MPFWSENASNFSDVVCTSPKYEVFIIQLGYCVNVWWVMFGHTNRFYSAGSRVYSPVLIKLATHYFIVCSRRSASSGAAQKTEREKMRTSFFNFFFVRCFSRHAPTRWTPGRGQLLQNPAAPIFAYRIPRRAAHCLIFLLVPTSCYVWFSFILQDSEAQRSQDVASPRGKR